LFADSLTHQRGFILPSDIPDCQTILKNDTEIRVLLEKNRKNKLVCCSVEPAFRLSLCVPMVTTAPGSKESGAAPTFISLAQPSGLRTSDMPQPCMVIYSFMHTKLTTDAQEKKKRKDKKKQT